MDERDGQGQKIYRCVAHSSPLHTAPCGSGLRWGAVQRVRRTCEALVSHSIDYGRRFQVRRKLPCRKREDIELCRRHPK
eukprot:6189070-Pleurochrysis_carterae.AAC.6